MEISVSELNELLQKEFERGRNNVWQWPYPITYTTDNHYEYIPEACKTCPNHPSNGGSGNCNCMMGTPKIYCNNGAVYVSGYSTSYSSTTTDLKENK